MDPVTSSLPAPWGLVIGALILGAGGAVTFVFWLRRTVRDELGGVNALVAKLEGAIKSLEDSRNAQTSFFAQQGVLMEKAHAMAMDALGASQSTQGYAARIAGQLDAHLRDFHPSHRNGANGSGYSEVP